MLPGSAYAFEDLYDSAYTGEITPEQAELIEIQKFFYEAPIITREISKKSNVEDLKDPYIKDYGGTPIFKQLRIKATNYFKTKNHEEYLKEKKFQEEEFKRLEKELEEETSLQDLQQKNLENFFDVGNKKSDYVDEKKKFTLFRRHKNEAETEQDSDMNNKNSQQAVENDPKSEDSVKIEGGVKKIEAEKDVILDCEVVNYLEETNEVEALGRPVLKFPAQETTLIADRITYNVESNIIKAFGNVVVIKNGQKMLGDFLQININEENSFITDLRSPQPNVTVYANRANASDDLVELEDGKLASEHSYILKLKTHSNRVKFERMIIPEASRSHLDDLTGHAKLKIVAKNVKVTANDEHDVFKLEDAIVQAEDTKLFKIKKIGFHTNKHHNYVETDFPEVGSRSLVGMYAGPGYVYDAPWGASLKVMPIINYKDSDWGIGGALRYSSSTNRTSMVYGSAKDIFVMRGRQSLDDKLFLHYGVNSYMNDWWMGQRMAKYLAEFIYADGQKINDFMGAGRPLTFRQRISAGYIHDSEINRYGESIKGKAKETTRFKYMSQLSQSIYSYHNNLKRLHLDTGVSLMGSAALYGTGDTQFIGRVGPYLRTQYKYWMQDIGYFQSTYTGNSPVPRFDLFRYGKSNVYFKEAVRLNKYLILAYSASLNLSDDAPNGKMFQENSFIVSFGPDDLRIVLGYDCVRKTTYFNINVALDTKGSSIEYENMEIRHPEKLGRSDKKYVQPVVFPEELPPKKAVKRQFAQVINIEDPNKEQI